MIKITSLSRIYRSKKKKSCPALHNINLTLSDKGLVFLLGKSGSGKSTLLNLIGGLDTATEGKIEVDGHELSAFSKKELADYRNSHVGFVFQDYLLLDELTVYENVAISLDFKQATDKKAVSAALCKVGLSGYEDRYPSELSGGERQRAAIARALVKKPVIILADEPTGNLDDETAKTILDLLKNLSKEGLVFVVSHNATAANNYADRIIELSDGRIVSDSAASLNESLAKLPENTQPTQKQIEKRRVGFTKKVKLCGQFLKHKLSLITLYSFMAAAVIVIMALSQTIAGFDAGKVIEKEMSESSSDSLYITKTLSNNQKNHISKLGVVVDCFPEINESDIQKFRETGYVGEIYPVLKYNLNISKSNVSAGMATNIFENSPYILEPIGTIVVDEAFLEKKFGEVNYLAKAETFQPTGVIITDYIADIIILSDQVEYATDYESLIGEYHWGTKEAYSCVARGYINGIIHTGYKEKYKEIFKELEIGLDKDLDELLEDEVFLQLVEDIHNGYGFCYSLNPDFKEAAIKEPSWEMLWHYSLKFDDNDLFAASIPQVRSGSFFGIELKEDEVLMEMTSYNKVFGTEYTSADIDNFTPHTTTLSHYKYFDADQEAPLFTREIKIAGLFVSDKDNMSGTLIAGNGVYDAFAKDHIYTTGLYFDGGNDLSVILETAGKLGYQRNLTLIESIQTMTKSVEIFVPIFRLIAVILCVAIIFILMNFATKMINGKLHEIGIMKALGAQNGTIGVVFGLQVALIAVLTMLLSAFGYFVLVDVANDLLLDSLKTLAPNRIILDLDFLTFDKSIVLTNCLLISLLSLVSFVVPMIKIRKLDPVKIITARR